MTLCLLAGTSAFAQDRRAPRTKERPTAEQMAQRKTDRMVEKLNLNEDQSKQLYELNLQEVKDMQAQHERMRAARKAKAEKMQKILTPEQFEQWKQMQGPKPGMGHGPQMKDGKGCACKEGLVTAGVSVGRLAPLFCRFTRGRGEVCHKKVIFASAKNKRIYII